LGIRGDVWMFEVMRYERDSESAILSCGFTGVLKYKELDFQPENLDAGDEMRCKNTPWSLYNFGDGERVNCGELPDNGTGSKNGGCRVSKIGSWRFVSENDVRGSQERTA
jgi:hypothetical protein